MLGIHSLKKAQKSKRSLAMRFPDMDIRGDDYFGANILQNSHLLISRSRGRANDNFQTASYKKHLKVAKGIIFWFPDTLINLLTRLGKILMSESVEDKIKSIIVSQLGVEEGAVTLKARFVEDLGADSLDIVELVMAMEESFSIDIPDDEAENLLSVEDAVNYVKKMQEA